ncbi:MAG: arginine--tRNA ligase, partial [Candidatus Aenigmatarchaeota archaeon]
NFFLDMEKFTDGVLTKILSEREKYGRRSKIDKTAVVEFPAPNTNKPLHVGHLRNMALGESISRLLESQGYDVNRVNLYNDRGIHICQSMLGYKKWGEGREPDKKPDHFVGDYYVKFNQEAESDPILKEKAQEMLRDWEKGDPDTVELWKKMNEWVYEGHNKTYNKFGVSFDKIYYESDTYEKGKEIVEDGLKKDLFYEDETGAVKVDVGDLGEKVLIRSDGTSVYITQDLYLAEAKYQDFNFDRSIYVVGNEQNYHFRVLFKIFDMLDKSYAGNCYHLSYGMVNLPEGKLKSREGKVVDADDLICELVGMANEEVRKRNEISGSELENLAEKIGLGALKFFLLKFTASKDFTFQPEESVSFEGETGPYIQYSYVRAKRILEKSEKEKDNIDFGLLVKPEEKLLIKKMNKFPDILSEATESYDPHVLAKFVFELASLFSSFYEKHPVIDAENKDLEQARLTLVKAFSHVIKSSLYFLGIESPKKM